MTTILDHTIVPVGDKRRSAQLLGELVGVVPGEPTGPFIPVQVNRKLTLDFDERFGATTRPLRVPRRRCALRSNA